MGELTADTISVTNDSTGDLGLTGNYKLVYGDSVSDEISTKDGLWGAVKDVADNKGEFDVTKAKLVRYVKYYISYDKQFTSIDLANNVTNDGINFLNARKTDKSIWQISSYDSAAGSYTYKMVSGGSFDTGLEEYLQTYDCNGTVYLYNKNEIYLTATDPSTCTTNSSTGDYQLGNSCLTFDSDNNYPVKVSDLAATLILITN